MHRLRPLHRDVPVSTFPPMRGEDLGLKLPHHCVALLYPAISSYVGGDIVAGVMGSGMLPEVDPDKIVYVGNGSLMGAWMSALSNHIRKDVVEVVRKMTSFELSEIPGFKDKYVASLFLPHTDLSLFPKAAQRRSAAK